jgi:hypothetical protein
VLIAREPQALRSVKAALAQAFQDEGSRGDPEGAWPQGATTQSHTEALKEPGHLDCRTVATPADGYESLQRATAQGTLFAGVATYQRAQGQRNRLVQGTRPALAFVVPKLSQFYHQPLHHIGLGFAGYSGTSITRSI